LQHCASDVELEKFKVGKLDKTFGGLIAEFEEKIGTPSGVLSHFEETAWNALNGFTHSGVSSDLASHSPGKVEGNYPEHEVAKALGVAGALGLIAGGQVIALAGRQDLVPLFMERMKDYAKNAP
jgi:hypothetical protein